MREPAVSDAEDGLVAGECLRRGEGMHRGKTDARVAQFWDRESSSWGTKYGRKTSYFYRCRTFHEYFASTKLERASILDYGCGAGDITFPMLQTGHSVTGVDIAQGMVSRATERAGQAGLASRASYHLLDDAALSRISSVKFDVVVCSSVLEYVDDDRALLSMFHDVLRDGGYLLVSVPDRRSVYCKLDLWLHARRHHLPRFFPVGKLGYLDIQKRQYDIAAFARDVEALGFQLEASKHNSITLQRGLMMEKLSNIPGIGMLALMKFRKRSTMPA
jgi:2-polyprenyl-3-methyl-5-hydroxy-6-metoxy-1,4-benzoquinol methylase